MTMTLIHEPLDFCLNPLHPLLKGVHLALSLLEGSSLGCDFQLYRRSPELKSLDIVSHGTDNGDSFSESSCGSSGLFLDNSMSCLEIFHLQLQELVPLLDLSHVIIGDTSLSFGEGLFFSEANLELLHLLFKFLPPGPLCLDAGLVLLLFLNKYLDIFL